jgi:hypothetical protein
MNELFEQEETAERLVDYWSLMLSVLSLSWIVFMYSIKC